jgi:hypothetical protein
VDAALVRRQSVNLVDDHRARRREHAAPGLGSDQDVQRFRRRHHDVRRLAAHALALRGRRVAGPHEGADLDIGEAARLQLRPDSGEWRLEVLLDVVRERLQRRDVDDLRRVREPAFEALPHESVDRGEERRERLARPGRRRDDDVLAGRDRRPRLELRPRRLGEAALEPGGDGRMETGEGHRGNKGYERCQIKLRRRRLGPSTLRPRAAPGPRRAPASAR